jgi:hypothetical protein
LLLECRCEEHDEDEEKEKHTATVVVLPWRKQIVERCAVITGRRRTTDAMRWREQLAEIKVVHLVAAGAVALFVTVVLHSLKPFSKALEMGGSWSSPRVIGARTTAADVIDRSLGLFTDATELAVHLANGFDSRPLGVLLTPRSS